MTKVLYIMDFYKSSYNLFGLYKVINLVYHNFNIVI